MSSKDNNEVAVEKIDNDKSADAKCDLKGTKRAAEVSSNGLYSACHHDSVVSQSSCQPITG